MVYNLALHYNSTVTKYLPTNDLQRDVDINFEYNRYQSIKNKMRITTLTVKVFAYNEYLGIPKHTGLVP